MRESKKRLRYRLLGLRDRPHMNGTPLNVFLSAKLLVDAYLQIHNDCIWVTSLSNKWLIQNVVQYQSVINKLTTDIPKMEDSLFTPIIENLRVNFYEVSELYSLDENLSSVAENLLSNQEYLLSFKDLVSLELAFYNLLLTSVEQTKIKDFRDFYMSRLKTSNRTNGEEHIVNLYSEQNEKYYLDIQEIITHIVCSLP